MSKNKMLIDASHSEETRVVVMKNNRVEEFDFESAARKLLKGSIYLAKITRVEPSLQAAFVDFGGNRHGFLAFNEVHPDYYQIPHADRLALLEAEAAANRAIDAEDDDDDDLADDIDDTDVDDGGVIEVDASDDDADDDVSDDDASDDDVAGDDVSVVEAESGTADDAEAPGGVSVSAADTADATSLEPERARAADLAAREAVSEDGVVVADDTAAPPVKADLVAPSKADTHMPVAEPTPELPTEPSDFVTAEPDATNAAADDDDERFAEIDALAETHAIQVGHLLPEAPVDPDQAASHDDAVSDADEVQADANATPSPTQELRTPREVRVVSEVLAPLPDVPDVDGLDDQPVIPELADAIEARGRRTADEDDDSGDDDADAASEQEGDDESGSRSANRTRGRSRNGGRRNARGRSGGRDSAARAPRRTQLYKIQEVIRRRQIVLVQVVKEERGTKGAALTTYLSLAGRYTVLMPNTARGGGISRKITNAPDRKRLKAVAQDLDVPEGMGLIIRTAGASRTKQEIKRDFEYLLRLWESVRDLTLRSQAPSLVYE
ncbi:MAG: ribonuclease E/G, partial [Pseudomonadota bacterium]